MPKPASKYNMMILVSWKIEATSSGSETLEGLIGLGFSFDPFVFFWGGTRRFAQVAMRMISKKKITTHMKRALMGTLGRKS